ncbi:uncharacterized protein LOC127243473 isoform X1 [Andrographis paniculata]|uniref:uncharacterized protein LOC127243473 isoform X1 n=1 Tax=Andrographis paniculata TaxID=175694 RepID=UPI0021E96E06|nr:uncharacterized protein LOC127243473 isoform X1 [Andrographis paniculata]
MSLFFLVSHKFLFRTSTILYLHSIQEKFHCCYHSENEAEYKTNLETYPINDSIFTFELLYRYTRCSVAKRAYSTTQLGVSLKARGRECVKLATRRYKVSKLTSSDNVAGILPEKSLLLRSRATRNFSLPISSGMVPPILLLLIYKDGGILPRSSYCRTAEVSDIENRGNCCCCRGRGKTTIALRLCREGSLRLGCWCPN